jgi:UDP-N-acetylmuramoyl-L-alanyl-D-glutamate--2,6-diaminopimelate ligase
MRLTELLVALSADSKALLDAEIRSVVTDSRRVAPGALFVAYRGERADGFDFVAEAESRGAAAIVSDRPRPADTSIPWLQTPEPRRAAGLLASRLFGEPALKMRLVGVTGTNGKTTAALLLQKIFSVAWGDSGFLGTTGYFWKEEFRQATRTTPEAPEIAAMLSEMISRGVPACAMEVSSHALALERVAGLSFDAALFTNLTRDHFDFHRNFDNYYGAKKLLFGLRKRGAPAIANRDDPFGRRLLEEIAGPTVSFSASGDSAADFRAVEVSLDLQGVRFCVEGGGAREPVDSPLLGRFNVENLLGAWSTAVSLEIPAERIRAAIKDFRGAPGRMERVDAGQPFTVLVDYAHTEDALRRLLLAVRELTDKTLILVFGCGGDRDRGKREPMGRAAAELSDIPIVTSDNPRGEPPEDILKEVEVGLRAGGATKYLRFVDRREAIEAAVGLANERSVVLIAGKGHEQFQMIGGSAIPFDDRRVAAESVRRLRRKTPS